MLSRPRESPRIDPGRGNIVATLLTRRTCLFSDIPIVIEPRASRTYSAPVEQPMIWTEALVGFLCLTEILSREEEHETEFVESGHRGLSIG